jgi:hypothetical protein
MLKLDNVTLVMIDSLDDYCDKSNIRIATMSRVLPKILEKVEFGDIISINPFNKNKDLIDKQIEQKVWNRNNNEIHSINWYCEFIVSKLPYMVKTDYYLIMQWDGFIIDPHNWSDDFYKFDYLGGGHTLLNGGFSLRKTETMKNIVENGNPQILANYGVDSEDGLYSSYFKFPKEFQKKEFDLPFYLEWPGENILSKFCSFMFMNKSFGWHRSSELPIKYCIKRYEELNIFSQSEIKIIRNYLLIKETNDIEFNIKDFSIECNESFFNY